jgi:hypothetical protein
MFILLIPSFLLAQTGKIRGVITDEATGEPLIGANVLIVGTSFGAATGVNGDFSITNLEAGVYDVRASYVGYQSKIITDVRINAGLTTSLDFQLPGEGFTVEEISVVAERPLVNKSATNANRITTGEDIEALPVRGVNAILALTPGVTFQDNTIFIRGGRQDEVGYYLEGASMTDPVVGGRSVNIVQDAIEEIQVQSGGYTAEYGGANSGIIYTQIKSGTPDWQASLEYITDNVGFKGRGDRFSGEKTLGSFWYGYSETIATLSGPVFGNNIKFFGLLNYRYFADEEPQRYPGIDIGEVTNPTTGDIIDLRYPAGSVQGNSEEVMNTTGTLTFDYNPIILRLVGTWSRTDQFNPFSSSRVAGNIANFMNTSRIEENERFDGAFSGKLTWIASPSVFAEVSAGFSFSQSEVFDPILKDNFFSYGDSIANANAGIVWTRGLNDNTGRFQRPPRIPLFDFSFNSPGDVTAGYGINNRDRWNINGALSAELGKFHSLKIGGELQLFEISNYSWGNEGIMALPALRFANDNLPAGDDQKVKDELVIIGRGVNNFGYDLYGNKYTGTTNYETGEIAPHKPTFAAFYVQDKIEWNDLIVNAGIRYDYIDIDNQTFIDPTMPELTINKGDGTIKPAGLVDVPTFNAISPRLGVSFAITDQTVFHAQYGKFVQQSRLRDAYQGPFATSNNLRGGFEITAPVGFNIRPTRTTQYEIGFTTQVGDFASFDITGYYKDIQDQIVFDKVKVDANSSFTDYNTLINGDFATTKGIELSFTMRRISRFQANANVTFQDARGTGSFPNSARGIVGAPIDGLTVFKPQYVSPLEYNNDVAGSFNLDYRFGYNDGPPALERFGISALINFTSGHPYTTGIGGPDLEGDARDRQPIEPLNASTTPATFQVDLRVDKTFNIADLIDLNIYVYVINLFDAENIQNVFLRTGSTQDDGYLSNPALGGQLIETFGPVYEQVYRAINIDYYEQYQNAATGAPITTRPFFYGPPRQIRLGIRLEY